VSDRYAGWSGELGRSILSGGRTLEDMASLVEAQGLDPQPVSGRQEWLETVINRFV
jgi:xylose isomerase